METEEDRERRLETIRKLLTEKKVPKKRKEMIWKTAVPQNLVEKLEKMKRKAMSNRKQMEMAK